MIKRYGNKPQIKGVAEKWQDLPVIQKDKITLFYDLTLFLVFCY